MNPEAHKDLSLRFGSLFSGVGGMDLGLERAGMKCAWQVEIDPFCRKVLAQHWPDVQRYNDVKECGNHNLEPVDLIAGGFPCTDLSFAGNGAGLDGKHSSLWRDMLRIVSELRPRYTIVENVPALLYRGMGEVLGGLASCGYDAEWDCIPAASVSAPHRRDRLFIVAYAPSERRNAGQIFDQRSLECFRESQQAWGAYRFLPRTAFRPPSQIPYATDERVPSRTGDRVDRFTALGNAVVPQVVEWIGKQILESHREYRNT